MRTIQSIDINNGIVNDAQPPTIREIDLQTGEAGH
jgi:hypothetical protein